MAIHYFVGSHTAGTELVNRIDISDNEPLTEAAAHGEVGRAGALIRDPTGTLDLDGWTPFYVTEDACSEPRLFTGWLVAREIRRGEGDFASVARTWDAQIVDLNHALTRRIIRDGKRPLETLAARVSWLLASEYVTGLVANGGLVDTAPTINYDESDYTDQRPIDVLQDVAPVAGKTFFTYWSTANARAELFLDQPADATFASTLRISNVAADVDDTDPTTQVTFAPLADWVVRRSPEEQFTGVVYDWRGGRIYQQNETLVTDLGGQRLDAGFSTDRVGRVATANAEVTRWLDQHAGEFDTITLSVRIHKTRVNLIRQGHRIEVKLSNVPGYSSFTWSRIQRRTVRKTKSPDWFVLNLTLSLRTPAIRGGGGTGGLPWQDIAGCPTNPTDVNLSNGTVTATGTGTVNPPGNNIPVNPTNVNDGNLATASIRNGFSAGAGTYTGSWVANLGTAFASCQMKVTDGPTYGFPPLFPALQVGGKSTTKLYWSDDGAAWTEFTSSASELITVEGGRTVHTYSYGVLSHRYWRLTIETTFTVATFETNFEVATWAIMGGSASPAAPPSPGQPVPPQTPTGTVDGSNTTFITPHPFADGSAKVYIDGDYQPGEPASYDGATGAVTLSFAPRGAVGDEPAEAVTIEYQGR